MYEKYKFNGGKDLFIKDTVWNKAKEIRRSYSLSRDAFTMYCQKQGIDQGIEEKKLLKCGITPRFVTEHYEYILMINTTK